MKPSAGAFLVALVATAACGCSTERPGTVVARVGESVLTLEEAKTAVDTTAPDADARLARYVTSWVNAELLHQEALRQGIEDDPEFGIRLGELRRQLANQELLDRMVYGDTASLPDSVLRAYFASHPNEFSLSENHLKLRLATFRGRETARRFAAAVTAGRPWQDLLDSMAADPGASGEIVSASDERWYTRATLYPPELWKVAGPLSPGEASFPLRTTAGFTVVQYVAIAPAGPTDRFDIVRDDVADRVIVESRRAKLEALLGTLRERYGVEVSIGAMRREGSSETDE